MYLAQRISYFLGQLHQYKIGQWCQYSRNIGFCKNCCCKIFSNDGMCQPRPSICRRRHLDTVDPKADRIDQELCGLKHQRNCCSCSCLINPSMPSWVTGNCRKIYLKMCTPNKAAVRVGATGAIAPIDFQKTLFVPVNFPKTSKKKKIARFSTGLGS